MAPRAAWRLETLGFSPVYLYKGGKADWAAAGWPVEGALRRLSAADVVRRDVPTCRLDDRLRNVREAVRASGWDTCVVVNDEGIVLGRLDLHALADDDVSVAEAATPAPVTVRPSIPLERLKGWMEEQQRESFLVTTSDGRLVGLVRREDAERALG
jgi:CBS domain-containing protein